MLVNRHLGRFAGVAAAWLVLACSGAPGEPDGSAPVADASPDAVADSDPPPMVSAQRPPQQVGSILPYGLTERVDNTACVIERPGPDGTIALPSLLSETGCYTDLVAKTPAPGLVAFTINSTLWTDGAFKRRFFALPPGTTIGYTDVGAWVLPVGTILMKEFILEAVEGDPSSRFVMETRFLVRVSETRWRGYSFKWNGAGDDAELLSGENVHEYEVTEAGGAVRTHSHLFPSRTQCLRCHSARAGGALGPSTAQMNRDHDYGGVVDNQLRAYEHVGLFSERLPSPVGLMPALTDPTDETASLEDRARSWLHANCAHCHQPEGSAVSSTLFIHWDTELIDTNACSRIEPGDSVASSLTSEMTLGNMPPIGTFVPDPRAQVVFDWVDSLTTCP